MSLLSFLLFDWYLLHPFQIIWESMIRVQVAACISLSMCMYLAFNSELSSALVNRANTLFPLFLNLQVFICHTHSMVSGYRRYKKWSRQEPKRIVPIEIIHDILKCELKNCSCINLVTQSWCFANKRPILLFPTHWSYAENFLRLLLFSEKIAKSICSRAHVLYRMGAKKKKKKEKNLKKKIKF